MGCCECHNHKFDPFWSRDFYQMEAFFADVKQWGVYADYSYTPNPDLKGVGNDHPFAPEIVADSPYLQQRQRLFVERMDETAATAFAKQQHDKHLQANWWFWCESTRSAMGSDGWTAVRPIVTAKAPAFSVEKDGSITLDGKLADETFQFPLDLPAVAMIRVELLPLAAHGGSILRGKEKTTTVKLSGKLHSADGHQFPLKFYYAEADRRTPHYSGGAEVLGILGGWVTSAEEASQPHTGVWILDKPLAAGAGSKLELTLQTKALGRIRISVSPLFAIGPLKPGGACRDTKGI